MNSKVTTRTIRKLKKERPVVSVTAYDAITARLADKAGIDVILVGDSVGTTLLGYETTVPVTLEMIAHHCGSVARAKTNAMVLADLPFGYAAKPFEELLDAAIYLMQQAGAEAVKLEGGEAVASKVKGLVDAGVPVMGHVGLLPQQVYAIGGYRKFGKTEQEAEQLQKDVLALQEAGVFAIIGEMIDHKVAAALSRSLDIPLIGIGCGSECDGQVLVSTDLLGLNDSPASFVKEYTNLKETITGAFKAFSEEVIQKKF